MSQKGLRSLALKGCPEVDDWFLARLHVFGETLQELDLSHCPRITEGGLPALQHLRSENLPILITYYKNQATQGTHPEAMVSNYPTLKGILSSVKL